jgi:hypothetical protein
MFGVVGDRIGHRDLLAIMRATGGAGGRADDAGAVGQLAPVYVFLVPP